MAKKIVTVYFCQQCGYESSKWMGQCPGCREWNTFVEETMSASDAKNHSKSGVGSAPSSEVVVLNTVKITKEDKLSTKIAEFDRVLGGGILDGSMTLVGGDPGIGKSTLLLQTCKNLADSDVEVLYVSGEESQRQIKLRADRIGEFSDKMSLLCETNMSSVSEVIRARKPRVVIIDSIQTMYNDNVSSAPGSVSQVRETTAVLLRTAKEQGISIFIVGHVTKDGAVAGPRVLEHMVDTVLYFEGDRHASYRLLRAVKNRFGSTDEIGVFEMRSEGLAQVANPSEFMLDGRQENGEGSVVTCTMEGTRPILVEIQALVCESHFEIPRRQSNGIEYNRLNMLIAVLENKCKMPIGGYDAYLNITGGLKISEPAIDLGIVLAIASSFKMKPMPGKMIAFGEVGLSGEVRSVANVRQRVMEAKKLGFESFVVPQSCAKECDKIDGIQIVSVSNIKDAFTKVFR